MAGSNRGANSASVGACRRTGFPLCQPDPVRGLYLPRHVLLFRLCTLLNALAIELELIPVGVTTLIERHQFPPFLPCFLPLPFGRPPILPFLRAISCSRSSPNRSSLAL